MNITNPALKDFDELLAYLPALYADSFRPVRSWSGDHSKADEALTFPHPESEEIVRQFFCIAERECWVDYEYTLKKVDEVICNPERVACATLQEIKGMLTWCVRGERFCDGHWGRVIADGYVRSVLLRLQALRPQ